MPFAPIFLWAWNALTSLFIDKWKFLISPLVSSNFYLSIFNVDTIFENFKLKKEPEIYSDNHQNLSKLPIVDRNNPDIVSKMTPLHNSIELHIY